MNLAAFNITTIVTAVMAVIIFLVFRYLAKGKGKAGIIIYVAGDLCLAVGLYAVGLMVVDIVMSDYFKDVEVYGAVSNATMIVVALGLAILVATVDGVAKDLRSNKDKAM